MRAVGAEAIGSSGIGVARGLASSHLDAAPRSTDGSRNTP